MFCLLSNTNAQIIPLRFDLVLSHLRQNQYYSFNSPTLYEEYNFTPERMLKYISMSLPNNETSLCERDFQTVLQAALKQHTWALKVLDAWGKPLPSGVLKGNTYWVGNYDECIHPMYNPANKSFIIQPFDTQHCMYIHLIKEYIQKFLLGTLVPTKSRSQSNSMASLVFGLCVPSSCDRQSLVSLVHMLFTNISITEDNLACSNDLRNGQKGLSNGAIATLVVLSFLGLLVLIGTAIDVFLMSKINSVGDQKIQNDVYNHLVECGND